MPQYFLSVHGGDCATQKPMSEEDMQAMMTKILGLEADMKSSGTWVFGGQLHAPDTATVVRPGADGTLTTDGPFAESKEHLGGFYIIEAEDLDAALKWADRVVDCIGSPIEVRPFVQQPQTSA